jgi:hypothetical protein
MEEGIMKYETVLPEDFNGVFNFTNPTDEDFIGIWGKKEYRFAKQSTSPMIMPEYSPLEIQHIRKKFAKDLGERAFFNSEKYQTFLNQERNADGSPKLNSMHQGGQYSDSELTSFIQQCLIPLPLSKATVTESKIDKIEDKLTRNDEGELNSEAIDRKASLRTKALNS